MLGKIFLWLALAYFIGALALLATVKAHKDKDGHAIIDHNAWYFTAAYPYRRNSRWFIENVTTSGLNICPFYARLFFAVLFIWPFLIIIEIAKLIIQNTFTLPFGIVCKPGLAEVVDPSIEDIIMSPYDKIVRIFNWSNSRWYIPAGVYALYYVICWMIFPGKLMWPITGAIAVVITAIAIIIGCGWIIDKIKARKVRVGKIENEGKTSLFDEWLRAKKSKVCMKLKVV